MHTAGTKMLGVVYQKVGRDSGLHEGIDSISHQSSWKALEKCDIESNYISLLRNTMRGTERDCLNGQNETGRSFV